MGIFSYNAYWRYDSAGNIVGSVPPATITAIRGTTLTDSQPADLQFTPGDAITSDGSVSPINGTGTYIGTIELTAFPGVTWVGITYPGGDTAYFATLPPATTGSDINNAWRAQFGAPHTASTVEPSLQNTTSLDVLCFAAGTLIATPGAERAVETLQIGDLILTADGRAVPVKWIGRQTLHRIFTPANRFEPVRIAAGALGDGLPHTDLVLTSDHAMILDGFAVNAGALVNGTTITRVPAANLPERVTYYHIETEAHDVVLANGAAAETFVDYIGRRAFDNHEEYVALYGDEPVIAEMPLPRISSRRQLPADLRARLGIADFAGDVTAEALAFLAAHRVA